MSTRGNNGQQAYSRGRAPSSFKDSMARIVQCEYALHRAGRLGRSKVSAALRQFWKYRDRLETIRVCDFHSDGQLGGFFFWHSLFLSSEALPSLPARDRFAHLEKFLDWILSIPEIDGSFLDSHELGKSYGTGMALLTLSNCRPLLK